MQEYLKVTQPQESSANAGYHAQPNQFHSIEPIRHHTFPSSPTFIPAPHHRKIVWSAIRLIVLAEQKLLPLIRQSLWFLLSWIFLACNGTLPLRVILLGFFDFFLGGPEDVGCAAATNVCVRAGFPAWVSILVR
jgi:hypothetical protein